MQIDLIYDPKPGVVAGPEPFPFDWEATAADFDPERDPIGYGSSQEHAIADLLTQLEERGD